ncbi:MAG: nitrogenase cofactor biosynthesis protein NifB [Eubacterium sp.]|jgi:nitrogenase cofactor biosynthesis protein NifB|nr:nitrogenase cofactor biosynthesis protein NifB [Eubacterium sp.]
MLITDQLIERKTDNQASDFIFFNTKMKQKTMTHPCYNGCNHENARIHLPVAPKCNIQCNYCVRKFDCVNESRPGVATRIISPGEALEKYIEVKKTMANLSVVGIAGPGDALCDFENTRKTLQLIKEYDSDITFCLSTNGLMLPNHADELEALGVSHVTVTINAVDPEISARIYKYVRYEGVEYAGYKAGALLLKNQLTGLNRLTEKGIVCKVNIVVLKGINDFHIPEIAKTVKQSGCYIVNIMPLIPVQGSEFEHLPKATTEEIMKLRKECGRLILQMQHCRQCRADAVGSL